VFELVQREDFLREVHARVRAFGDGFCVAAEVGDEGLKAAFFDSLRAYFQEQQRLGRSHPHLTEAVADHCPEAIEAVRLYREALTQARRLGEPTQSILLGMAGRLLELGLRETAGACAQQGWAEALRRGDYSQQLQAEELLWRVGCPAG